MSHLATLLDAGHLTAAHRPFPRALVHEEIWSHAIVLLAAGELTLLSVWADSGQVHGVSVALEV